MALTDPMRHLQAFALLVQLAALTGLMESSSDAFTLFAPDEKVRTDRAHPSVACCYHSCLLTPIEAIHATVTVHQVRQHYPFAMHARLPVVDLL